VERRTGRSGSRNAPTESRDGPGETRLDGQRTWAYSVGRSWRARVGGPTTTARPPSGRASAVEGEERGEKKKGKKKKKKKKKKERDSPAMRGRTRGLGGAESSRRSFPLGAAVYGVVRTADVVVLGGPCGTVQRGYQPAHATDSCVQAEACVPCRRRRADRHSWRGGAAVPRSR